MYQRFGFLTLAVVEKVNFSPAFNSLFAVDDATTFPSLSTICVKYVTFFAAPYSFLTSAFVVTSAFSAVIFSAYT